MWLTVFSKYLKISWPLVMLRNWSCKNEFVEQSFPDAAKGSNTDNSFSLAICVQVQTFPFFSCDFWDTCFHNYHNCESIDRQYFYKCKLWNGKMIMRILNRICSFTETSFFLQYKFSSFVSIFKFLQFW